MASKWLSKKRKLNHEQDKSEEPKVDQFTLRFPRLTEKILGQLDNQSLERFKEVSRSLKMTVENQRIYWIRMIQNYTKKNNQFEKEWKEAVQKTPIESVKRIATAIIWNNSDIRNLTCFDQVMSPLSIAAASGDLFLFNYLMEAKTEDFFTSKFLNGKTPFHLAASLGKHDICQVMIEKSKGIPMDDLGYTPLHCAAEQGDFGICELFLKGLVDKNPTSNNGTTPLHVAAKQGHFYVCDLIMKLLVDKNPADNRGLTPLHEAAEGGHLAICDLIMKELVEKNPVTNLGVTPLHEAAGGGYLDICELYMKKVAAKNPAMNNGLTPLHWAAEDGHLDVCELIMFELGDQNPAANDGSTPLHKAAEWGHLNVCELICNNVQDKNPKDINGETPLEIARERKDWKLLYFLIAQNGLNLS